jgi:hypothetical protein
LFIVNSAFSQVRFGIKAGVNLVSLTDVEASGSGISMKMFQKEGMVVGYHAGAFANIGLGDVIGFQPELLFSMQGGKQKLSSLFEGFMGGAKQTLQFGYVQIPLLLEVKPFAGLGILGGPQFGYNISRKSTTSYDGITETLSGSDFDDELDGFKKADVGLAFGLQYTFAKKVTIGARYNIGLTNAIDYSLTEDGVSMNMKGWNNDVIQISLGFRF